MTAAKAGQLAALTQLIDEHGADVNVQAERSLYTPLILAAYDGHEACVRALLARGADVRLVNKWGETALASATKQGHGAVAALLAAASHEATR